MKKLYICFHPYILYKTLVERMGDEENSYSLLLTDAISDLKPIVPALRKSGMFEQVEFFSCEPYRHYYDLFLHKNLPKSPVIRKLAMTKNYLVLMLSQRKFKKIALPFDLGSKKYDKIICADFDYVINARLSMNHIEYAVFEHAKNVYQYFESQKLWHIYTHLRRFLDKTHLLKGVGDTSRYCKEIIVNDTAAALSWLGRNRKVTIWDVDEHIAALTAQQKDQIFQLYVEGYSTNIDADQTYDLLLTSPLHIDAYLPSEGKQIQFYKDVIRDHFTHPVLIKPHPRDTVDYRRFFPECAVIDQNISSEILILSQNLKLGTVLTAFSSSGESFRERAEELVVLEDYRTPAAQMESLKAYR